MKSTQKYIFTLFLLNRSISAQAASGLVHIDDGATDLICNTADLQSEIKISYLTAGDGANFSPFGPDVLYLTTQNIDTVNAVACPTMTFDTSSDDYFIVKVPEACMINNGDGYGTSEWGGDTDTLVVGLTMGGSDTVETGGVTTLLIEQFSIDFQCSFNDTYYLKADIGTVTKSATTLVGVNADSKYNFKMVLGTDSVTNYPAITALDVDTLTAGDTVHAVIYADNSEPDKFPTFTAAVDGLQFVPQTCVYGVVEGDYDWKDTTWKADASIEMCSTSTPMPASSTSLADHLEYSLEFDMGSNAWHMTFNTFLFSGYVDDTYTLMCTVKVCDDANAANPCDAFVTSIETQAAYVGAGVANSGLFNTV